MPLYQPPVNPFTGPVTPQSAEGDLLGMTSPVGMAFAPARNNISKLMHMILRKKHEQRLLSEMTPQSLPGFPQAPIRPAAPPTFTPPETGRMNSAIEQWLQKVSPEQEDQMMRRFVYPNR